MQNERITRRDFVRDGSIAAATAAVALQSTIARAGEKPPAGVKKTRSYNANMEYRALGRTGLWVSAVCLGGHWKRVAEATGQPIPGVSLPKTEAAMKALKKNRYDVMTRCMESGINYVDACTEAEISVYGPALKGRRDKMYMGFAMWPHCPRRRSYRNAKALLAKLEEGMKRAQVDYVDVWRLVASTPGRHSKADVEAFIEAFETAKKQGKARFTGVSSHGRPWLKTLAEQHPKHFQVLLFPYTAASKEMPKDSLFDAVRKHGVGTFGIKPFADASLFAGAKDKAEKARRARLAIRYILGNPAITAPIPGLACVEEVDNVVQAIRERRELAAAEKAELEQAGRQMWANLRPDYEWLRDWEYV
jgi:aryl-alcohol dehydrogenase-like predicted oxidoreductase